MFINESKFIVFVFSSLDSLLKNFRRFKISLISHSFNQSRNITLLLISTITIFDSSSTFKTSSIFNTLQTSNILLTFDLLLIIIENSIVLLNVQHLNFFNLVFLLSRIFKILIYLLFFSIIRRSKTSTSRLFIIFNQFEKTRNIRDIINNIFTSNVFDLRINDSNIITQIKNDSFFEIIESTTNSIK